MLPHACLHGAGTIAPRLPGGRLQATTSLVFLPAIPSWLPLWGLLSPADAVSGTRGDSGDSNNGSTLLPSDGQIAEPGKDSPHDPAVAKAGRVSSTIDEKNGDKGEQDERDQNEGDDAVSALGNDFRRVALAGAGRSGGGGRGAVRLVQTIASADAPYRYAAVLHFWDVVSPTLGGERRGSRIARVFG